jgi:hypothetical protein
MVELRNKSPSSTGWFNAANSYAMAAVELSNCHVRSEFPEMPVRQLLHHSFELYLKSGLSQLGLENDEIVKLSHNFDTILKEFSKHEDKITLGQSEIEFGYLIKSRILEIELESNGKSGALVVERDKADNMWVAARYVVLGHQVLPSVEHVIEVNRSLHRTISRLLFAAEMAPDY